MAEAEKDQHGEADELAMWVKAQTEAAQAEAEAELKRQADETTAEEKRRAEEEERRAEEELRAAGAAAQAAVPILCSVPSLPCSTFSMSYLFAMGLVFSSLYCPRF